MQKFTSLSSIAAPIPLINIDTDMIIPKQFLKTIKRTGLGKNLFDEMRFDKDGGEISDFILNIDEYKSAKIIITRDNFGCGSSREHAPWALLDFGIRCIIAPSFADIFYNNCFKNAILPIILSHKEIEELLEYAKNKNNHFSVNLEKQELLANNKSYRFEIDKFRKQCLVEGLDDIGLTLKKEEKINEYEKNCKWKY